MRVVGFAAVAGVGAVMAGAALGLAAPASADLVDGTYDWVPTEPPGTTTSWVFTSCGAGCKRAESSEIMTARDFHLSGNTWSWTNPETNWVTTIDNNSLAVVYTAYLESDPIEWRSQLVKAG